MRLWPSVSLLPFDLGQHGTIRVYGRKDGKFSIWRQGKLNGSCAFGVQ